jgi:hypothetical protein
MRHTTWLFAVDFAPDGARCPGSGRAPGALKQGANLRDVFLLAIPLAMGGNLTTGAQRTIFVEVKHHICRLTRAPETLPTPVGHPSCDHLLRPEAMKRCIRSRPFHAIMGWSCKCTIAQLVFRRCGAEQLIAGGALPDPGHRAPSGAKSSANNQEEMPRVNSTIWIAARSTTRAVEAPRDTPAWPHPSPKPPA